MKTTEELRKLDNDKLQEELNAANEELFKVSFGVKNQQAANSDQIKKRRRYVARIQTVRNENKNGKVEKPLEKAA